MKNFFKFMSVGIIAATSLTLVSCSDDDDDNNGGGNGMPKPTEVFTAGVPTSFDGAAITKQCTIKYTDATVTTPIVNKGCIMMFDECFGIDMDELQIAYYAGLLGKATKNLPVANDDNTFTWTLNSNGLPTQLKSVYGSYPDNYDIYTFGW